MAYILDGLAGYEVAYSLRRLRTLYSGKCIKVRREDGAEVDVSFDGESISMSSAVTPTDYGNTLWDFSHPSGVGNGCTVAKWYDQSGNNYHLSVSNQEHQPLIIDAGVLEVSSFGKPKIVFDGVNDWLNANSAWTNTWAQPNTFSTVARYNATGGYKKMFSGTGNQNIVQDNSGDLQMYAGSSQTVSSPTHFDIAIRTFLFDDANSKYFEDGALLAEKDSGSQSLTDLNLGGTYLGAQVFNGDYYEFILFGTTLTDEDRTILEQDQEDYYITPIGGTSVDITCDTVDSINLDSVGSDISTTRSVNVACDTVDAITLDLINSEVSTGISIEVICETVDVITLDSAGSIVSTTKTVSITCDTVDPVTLDIINSEVSTDEGVEIICSTVEPITLDSSDSGVSAIRTVNITCDTVYAITLDSVSSSVTTGINIEINCDTVNEVNLNSVDSSVTSNQNIIVTCTIVNEVTCDTIDSEVGVTGSIEINCDNVNAVNLVTVSSTISILGGVINNIIYSFTSRDKVHFILMNRNFVRRYIMKTFTKQSSEIIPISLDFRSLLQSVEEISSVDIKVYNYDTDLDVTAEILERSVVENPIIKATVKSGTVDTRYKITIQATTSEGNLYEEDVFMNIADV